MSILQRILKGRDDFWFSLRRSSLGVRAPLAQRMQYAPQPQIVQQQPERKERKVPLFGTSAGFGLDYVSDATEPRRMPDQQVNVQNIHGFALNAKPLLPPERPFEDANISRSFSKTSESTDQKPTHQRVSVGEVWDGIVRNGQKNPGIQGARGKSAPTPGDLHAADLRKYAYDFSG